MNIDHVCIAVRSIDTAAGRLETLFGYRPRTEAVVNTRQKVRVRFFSRPGSLDIKLIEPAGDDSPLWRSLRSGEGLHHLCFRVDSVPDTVERMREQGARVLAAPAPGEAFDDHLIAFLYAGLGLNVEIVDTDARRALVDESDV